MQEEEGEGEPPVRYQVYTRYRYRYLGTRTAGINILIFFLFSSPPFLFFSFNLIFLLKYHIFYLKQQEENWLLFKTRKLAVI